MALLFIDLDRHERINDRLGHPVSDGLMRSVGRLVESVPANDAQDIDALMRHADATVQQTTAHGCDIARCYLRQLKLAFAIPRA